MYKNEKFPILFISTGIKCVKICKFCIQLNFNLLSRWSSVAAGKATSCSLSPLEFCSPRHDCILCDTAAKSCPWRFYHTTCTEPHQFLPIHHVLHLPLQFNSDVNNHMVVQIAGFCSPYHIIHKFFLESPSFICFIKKHTRHRSHGSHDHKLESWSRLVVPDTMVVLLVQKTLQIHARPWHWIHKWRCCCHHFLECCLYMFVCLVLKLMSPFSLRLSSFNFSSFSACLSAPRSLDINLLPRIQCFTHKKQLLKGKKSFRSNLLVPP